MQKRVFSFFIVTLTLASQMELFYKMVAEELAARLTGLGQEDMAVLGLVEKAGNQGVWVRNLKLTTRLQLQQINKILKRLENRKLVKAIKSIAFKNRRMYMLYDLEPAKEVTGGVWYAEQQLDQELVSGVRKGIIRIMTDMGGSATPNQVSARLRSLGITHQALRPQEVAQVMDTLVFDGVFDVEGGAVRRMHALYAADGAVYASARAVAVDATAAAKRRGGGAARNIEYEGTHRDDDEDDRDDLLDEDEDDDIEDADRRYFILPSAIVPSAAPPAAPAAKKADHTHVNWMSSVPCGTCPVVHQCVPGGLVNPETCVYFSTWLQF
jgi:DNA-directed RNA polymerase III subunit RPC6